MGSGVESARLALGAGLLAPVDPRHSFLAVAVVFYLAFLAVVLLCVLAGRVGQSDDPTVGRSGAAGSGGSGPPGPDQLELSRTDLLPLFLARLARFAELARRPDVRANPERLRLTRLALQSAVRDCEALGAGDQARGLLEANQPG
jgi:hypothetical protein